MVYENKGERPIEILSCQMWKFQKIDTLLAGRMNAVNREFVYIENSSLGAKLAKFDRQLSPNLAHLGATWAILAPT